MSLFDPGKGARKRAAALAQQGIIKGGSFSGPGGIGGSFNFSGGQGSSNFNLGSFQSSLEGLQGLSERSLAQAGGGLSRGFTDNASNTQSILGQSNFNRLGNESDFNALGQTFQNASQTANADPFDLGSTIADKLRQLSERKNSRLVNKTFDRLKASGKLGTTGGAGIAGELENNLFEQGLQFDLAGLQAGQGLQRDAFGRMMGASQQREAIGGRQFGEDLNLNQFQNQAALQSFGIDQQMFQNLMSQQAQGAQIGLAANASAMATSQLPLAFQQAAMQANSQASNSLFAASGVEQQNAAMAKSPFLEALNAAGQFASGIAPGGFMGNPVGDS